jgi:hypothetical protein
LNDVLLEEKFKRFELCELIEKKLFDNPISKSFLKLIIASLLVPSSKLILITFELL